MGGGKKIRQAGFFLKKILLVNIFKEIPLPQYQFWFELGLGRPVRYAYRMGCDVIVVNRNNSSNIGNTSN